MLNRIDANILAYIGVSSGRGYLCIEARGAGVFGFVSASFRSFTEFVTAWSLAFRHAPVRSPGAANI